MTDTTNSLILEEAHDPNYEPTTAEIEEYAEFIGMDLKNESDQQLLWIAKEGLRAPLPPEWKPCKTEDGDIYYFNFESGESEWEHPCDSFYKHLYEKEKKQQQNRNTSETKTKPNETKIENRNKKKQKLKPISISPKNKSIEEIFNKDFANTFASEIDKLLESDVSSSSIVILSPAKKASEISNHEIIEDSEIIRKENKIQSPEIAAKLRTALKTLVPKSDPLSIIPSFNLNFMEDEIESEGSQISSVDKNKDRIMDESMEEWIAVQTQNIEQQKHSFLQKLEEEMKEFQKQKKSQKLRAIHQTLQEMAEEQHSKLDQMKIHYRHVIEEYDTKCATKKTEMDDKQKRKEQKVYETHSQTIAKSKKENELELKEIAIKHNSNCNHILQQQNAQIKSMREEHESNIRQFRSTSAMAMETINADMRNEEKKKEMQMEKEFEQKSLKFRMENESNLRSIGDKFEKQIADETEGWTKKLQEMKNEHKKQMDIWLKTSENSKIDFIADAELKQFKEKYASEIEFRKKELQKTMDKEFEIWEENRRKSMIKRKKFIEDEIHEQMECFTLQNSQKLNEKKENEKQILLKYEQNLRELKSQHCIDIKILKDSQKIFLLSIEKKCKEEEFSLESKHDLNVQQIQQKLKQQSMDIEYQLSSEYEKKREQMREEFKNKLKVLSIQLQTQFETLPKETSPVNIFNETIVKLKTENCDLQSNLKQLKISTLNNEKISDHEIAQLHEQIRELKLKNEKKHIILSKSPTPMGKNSMTDNECESVSSEQTLCTITTGFTSFVDQESEYLSVDMLSIDEQSQIPSAFQKWSAYLQQERQKLNDRRSKLNSMKSRLRKKQRKLVLQKNVWCKQRKRYKSLTVEKHEKIHQKNILKREKLQLDEKANEINEKVLQIRERLKCLSIQETRLQTLEVEYLRSSNHEMQANTNAQHIPSQFYHQTNEHMLSENGSVFQQPILHSSNSVPSTMYIKSNVHLQSKMPMVSNIACEENMFVPHPPPPTNNPLPAYVRTWNKVPDMKAVYHPLLPSSANVRSFVHPSRGEILLSNMNEKSRMLSHSRTSFDSLFSQQREVLLTMNGHRAWMKAFGKELKNAASADSMLTLAQNNNNTHFKKEKKRKSKEIVIRLQIEH